MIDPILINPYPGLRSFQKDENFLFFGREEQTAELLRLLRENRFIAVVGTSGSGKSSLVRAGLLPALHGGAMAKAGSHWEEVVMRPGGQPVANLAQALIDAELYDRDDPETLPRLCATLNRSRFGLIEAIRQSGFHGANLLIVVDQFEELFRFRAQDTEAKDSATAFVRLLLTAMESDERPIYVVMTMRSDYLGDCAQIPGLAQAVNRGEYLIPQLERAQRRDAIEKPALVAGGRMAPRLVQQLLNDAGDDQDLLPVLQHALMRMWTYWKSERREDSAAQAPSLDLEHYEAIGGLQAALSQHADEVYEELPDMAHREVAGKVFMALTERGADNRGIRRPTRFDHLCAIAGADEDVVRTVIEAFRAPGRTFLMPPPSSPIAPDTVIDISHESLMRVWKRLKGWVEVEAQSARIYVRLAETAQLRAEGKAGLYHDPDLHIAWTWWDQNKPSEAWGRRYRENFEQAAAFLEESRREVERLATEQEALRVRELEQARALAEARQRSARLFRRFGLAMSAVAIVAVVAFLMAWRARIEANAQAEQARAARDHAARLAREAEQILADTRQEEGRTWLLKAESLLEQKDSFGARMMAGRALGYEPLGRQFHDATFGKRFPILLQRGSSEAQSARAIASQPNLWAPLLTRHTRKLHSDQIFDLTFIRGGQTIVSVGHDGGIRFWDTASGDLVRQITEQNAFWQVFIPPAEDMLVAATRRGTLEFFDLASGTLTNTWAGFGTATLSQDGFLFAAAANDRTGGNAGSVRIWDRRTGAEQLIRPHSETVRSLKFTPDGRSLLTTAEDRTLRKWDLLSGQSSAEPAYLSSIGNADFGGDLICSPTGALAAFSVWHEGQSVIVWNSETWEEKFRIDSTQAQDRIDALAISPDGRALAIGYKVRGELGDGRLELWDLESARRRAEIYVRGGSFNTLRFSPDGSSLWFGTVLGALGRIHLDTEQIQPAPTQPAATDGYKHLQFSADSTRLYLLADGPAFSEQWDLLTGQVQAYQPGVARGQILSSDGRWMVRWDNLAEIYDLNQNPTNAADFIEADPREGRLTSASLSGDGKTLVLATESGWVQFYDTGTRQPLGGFRPHESGTDVFVSAHDLALVTVGADASSNVWVRVWGGAGRVEPIPHLLHLLCEWQLPPAGESAFKTPVTHDVSFEGNVLALLPDSQNLFLWDLDEGQTAPARLDTDQPVMGVKLSPDGSTLAAASEDGNIQFYDVASHRLLARISTLTGTERKGALSILPVTGMAFSPNGRLFAASDDVGNLTLWHIRQPSILSGPARTLRTHTDEVEAVVFGPRREWLASAGRDGSILLWTNRDGTMTSAPLLVTNQTWRVADLSADGSLLAAGSDQGWIYLIRTSTGELRHAIRASPSALTCVRLDPTGHFLASAALGEPIRLWSVDSAEMETELLSDLWKGASSCLAFDPTGNELIIGGDAMLYRWRRESDAWRLVETIGVRGQPIGIVLRPSVPSLLAAVRLDSSVGDVFREWSFAVGDIPSRAGPTSSGISRSSAALLRQFPAVPAWADLSPTHATNHLSCAQASPDGLRLATLTQSGVLTLLDAATGEILACEQAHSGPARALAFSPDGTTIATGGADGLVRLWPVEALLANRPDYASLLDYVTPEGRELEWKNAGLATNVFDAGSMAWRTNLSRPDLNPDRSMFPDPDRDAVLLAEAIRAGDLATGRLHFNRLPASARRDSDRHALGLIALDQKCRGVRIYVASATQATQAGQGVRIGTSATESAQPDRVLDWVRTLALLEVYRQLERSPYLHANDPVSYLNQSAALDLIDSDDEDLVPTGSVWKYLADGSNPGAAWKEPNFDDSSWTEAPGPFGFGDPGTYQTDIGRHRVEGVPLITAYFRHVSVHASANPFWGLTGRVQRDDGVVIYLNGVEIWRDGMPEGSVSMETVALQSAGGADETVYRPFETVSTSLVRGTNVVAVELHQNSRTSSDMHFDLALAQQSTSSAYLGKLSPDKLQDAVTRSLTLLPPELEGTWADRFRFAWSSETAAPPPPLRDDPETWILRSRVQALLGHLDLAREAVTISLRLLGEQPDRFPFSVRADQEAMAAKLR